MNVSFPILRVLAFLAILSSAKSVFAQAGTTETGGAAVSGQQLIAAATQRLEQYSAIESKMRVRTDLMGQPLVGSGSYAQLKSTTGLLLRMDLAIQAGQQTTSIKQISDGSRLYEHWRIGEAERVNEIDLREVSRRLRETNVPISMSSANLATGGLPRLTRQLAGNFDFDARPVRAGKLANLDVWALTGIWNAKRLAASAPDAIDGSNVVLEKLPKHLPHQVEIYIGKSDLFPYRITYQKWNGKEEQLTPVVTTEFFEVKIGGVLDSTQFKYEPPAHLNTADKTDVFLKTLGVATRPQATATR